MDYEVYDKPTGQGDHASLYASPLQSPRRPHVLTQLICCKSTGVEVDLYYGTDLNFQKSKSSRALAMQSTSALNIGVIGKRGVTLLKTTNPSAISLTNKSDARFSNQFSP